jgi:hypothetical protein
MSANFSRKGMSRRHTTGKKRPRHTVFVCRFADTTHTCPEEEEEGRRLYYNVLQLAVVKFDAAKLVLSRI